MGPRFCAIYVSSYNNAYIKLQSRIEAIISDSSRRNANAPKEQLHKVDDPAMDSEAEMMTGKFIGVFNMRRAVPCCVMPEKKIGHERWLGVGTLGCREDCGEMMKLC